ncbi:MAG: acetyl-CoA carboxylase carboxyltransferase subunit beta [Candidatus Dormibacteria bacterium]
MDGSSVELMARRRRPVRELPPPGPRPRPVTPPGTITCQQCSRSIASERFDRSLRVCPSCGHHAALPAIMRAGQLADAGTLEVLRLDLTDRDPLGFNDGIPYPERVAGAREKTGLEEAFVIARATTGGVAVALACMDFGFLGGSLGSAAGESFARACEMAVADRRPLITVCTSGGARMQEGIVSLAQMARCSVGVSAVGRAGLPYISVLADPCFGGVTASFAVQADVIVAEPRARIGFAGGRVIELATQDRLPEGFQTSEFLLGHGMIDVVVQRSGLRELLTRLLGAFISGRSAS